MSTIDTERLAVPSDTAGVDILAPAAVELVVGRHRRKTWLQAAYGLLIHLSIHSSVCMMGVVVGFHWASNR